jgi:twitching motility protein PilI
MAENKEPFALLEEFAQRARQSARGLPAQQEIKAAWRGIGFSIGGQHYVAPINEIAEVLDEPHYTRLPGVKSWVKGVANVRGRLIPIIDLMGFLDERVVNMQRAGRLLVVTRKGIANGLVVDSIFGMQHFVADSLQQTIKTTLPEKIRSFVKGAYVRDGQEWILFDLFKLAEDPGFLQVAI